MKACSDVPKLLRKGKALFSHLNNLEREKFKVHLPKSAPQACICDNIMMYFSVMRTSPQPLADVTLRMVMFMLPPPVPLCVDSEPDRTAVSEFVKGA